MLIVLVCLCMLVDIASHPNFPLYVHRLAQGWMFGRAFVRLSPFPLLAQSLTCEINNCFTQDNSDVRYRSFRSNIPALTLLLSVFFIFKYLYTFSLPSKTYPSRKHLLPFYSLFSVLLIFILHGTSAFFVLAILGGNYALAMLAPQVASSKGRGGGKVVVGMMWTFNCAVLFMNEKYGGYDWGAIYSGLSFMVRYLFLSIFVFPLTISMRGWWCGAPGRIAGKACIRGGTSQSILRCSDSLRSVWIIGGLAQALARLR